MLLLDANRVMPIEAHRRALRRERLQRCRLRIPRLRRGAALGGWHRQINAAEEERQTKTKTIMRAGLTRSRPWRVQSKKRGPCWPCRMARRQRLMVCADAQPRPCGVALERDLTLGYDELGGMPSQKARMDSNGLLVLSAARAYALRAAAFPAVGGTVRQHTCAGRRTQVRQRTERAA